MKIIIKDKRAIVGIVLLAIIIIIGVVILISKVNTSNESSATNKDAANNITCTPTPTLSVAPTKTSTPSPTPTPTEVPNIFIDEIISENYSLDISTKAEIIYTLGPETTTLPYEVSFSTSDDSIFIIEDNYISPLGPGNATLTITVTQNDYTYSEDFDVTITAYLTGIDFGITYVEMDKGVTYQTNIAKFPTCTTNTSDVTYKSSDESVATVSSSGLITGVDGGTCTVSAICDGYEDKITVSILVPVTYLSINTGAVTLNKGDSYTLTTTVKPENTTDAGTLSFISSDTKIATVNNGTITAVGPGSCVITVSCDTLAVQCAVTVLSPLTSISLDYSEITIMKGTSFNINPSFAPLDTTDSKELTWKSSNKNVATAKDNTITALSEGTVNLTASCGNHTAELKVNVIPYEKITDITLSDTSYTFDELGQTYTLNPKVIAETTETITLSYKSADSSIAKVSNKGIITAVANGTTTITITAGDFSKDFSVIVNGQKFVVALDPGHDGLHIGASGNGCREEELNLKVAKYCKAYLENNYKNVKVILTRNGDEHKCEDLHDCMEAKVQYAQDNDADIYVSMHFNAAGGHGTMVLISQYYTVAEETKKLGQFLLDELMALGIPKNKGLVVRPSEDGEYDSEGRILDYYYVIKQCAFRKIPGVIIEHCYIDSSEDYKFFNSEAKLESLGIADAKGIAAYLGL